MGTLVIKQVRFSSPNTLLGKAIHIYLKAGAEFNFKVIACDAGNIYGYDDEGLNLGIALDDIDFILGGY